MQNRLTPAALIAILAAPLPPATAWAQSRGLSAVAPYAGRLVWVRDRTGSELLARVVSATDSELGVTVGGVGRTIPVTGIARVSIDGDSITDGMLIGAAIGVPWGVLACQGARTRCATGTNVLAGIAISGALGAWLDARHHGRTVLYRAPGP